MRLAPGHRAALPAAAIVLLIGVAWAVSDTAGLSAEPLFAADDPQKLGWAPQQAAGPPDTTAAGDIQSAWASRQPDAQVEWLELTYPQAVAPRAVLVYETFNPGALSKVSVFKADGDEIVVWTGSDPTPPGSHKGISAVSVKNDFKVSRVKIYLDSPVVKGWNEIDAVGLRDARGKTHWATSVKASSTYARLDLLPVAPPPAARDEGCGDDLVDQAIGRACADLASDSFAVRERATLTLIKAGRDSIPLVALAAEDTDIEVSSRAVRVLLALAESKDDKTSPRAVAALVELTKSSNRAAARRAGSALQKLELRRWAKEQATVALLQAADAALDTDGDGRVTRVNLALTRGTPKVLILLRRLSRLTAVDLSGAEINDDDLAHLGDLDDLVELKLIHTPLGGTGLAHLRELSALRTLHLFATDVDDAGLVHLQEMKKLRTLTLNASRVTLPGVAVLRRSLPGCRIEWDGDE